jgi:hypothetical protein
MKTDHISDGNKKCFFLFVKALRDGTELFVDATEFCSQLDW